MGSKRAGSATGQNTPPNTTPDTATQNNQQNLEPNRNNDVKGDKGDTPETPTTWGDRAKGLGKTALIGGAVAGGLALVAPGLVGSVLGTGQASGVDPVAQVAAAGTANSGQPSPFDTTGGSFLKNSSPPQNNSFAMPPMGMVNGMDTHSSVPQLPPTQDFGLGFNNQTHLRPLIDVPNGSINNTLDMGGIGGGMGVGIGGGMGVGIGGGMGVGGMGVGMGTHLI